MAKKDFTINEDIDRGGNDRSAEINKEQPSEKESNPVQYTEVKNANASGLGSMGRNTEEPTSIEIRK
jgi:hypothetical protein